MKEPADEKYPFANCTAAEVALIAPDFYCPDPIVTNRFMYTCVKCGTAFSEKPNFRLHLSICLKPPLETFSVKPKEESATKELNKLVKNLKIDTKVKNQEKPCTSFECFDEGRFSESSKTCDKCFRRLCNRTLACQNHLSRCSLFEQHQMECEKLATLPKESREEILQQLSVVQNQKRYNRKTFCSDLVKRCAVAREFHKAIEERTNDVAGVRKVRARIVPTWESTRTSHSLENFNYICQIRRRARNSAVTLLKGESSRNAAISGVSLPVQANQRRDDGNNPVDTVCENLQAVSLAPNWENNNFTAPPGPSSSR